MIPIENIKKKIRKDSAPTGFSLFDNNYFNPDINTSSSSSSSSSLSSSNFSPTYTVPSPRPIPFYKTPADVPTLTSKKKKKKIVKFNWPLSDSESEEPGYVYRGTRPDENQDYEDVYRGGSPIGASPSDDQGSSSGDDYDDDHDYGIPGRSLYGKTLSSGLHPKDRRSIRRAYSHVDRTWPDTPFVPTSSSLTSPAYFGTRETTIVDDPNEPKSNKKNKKLYSSKNLRLVRGQTARINLDRIYDPIINLTDENTFNKERMNRNKRRGDNARKAREVLIHGDVPREAIENVYNVTPIDSSVMKQDELEEAIRFEENPQSHKPNRFTRSHKYHKSDKAPTSYLYEMQPTPIYSISTDRADPRYRSSSFSSFPPTEGEYRKSVSRYTPSTVGENGELLGPDRDLYSDSEPESLNSRNSSNSNLPTLPPPSYGSSSSSSSSIPFWSLPIPVSPQSYLSSIQGRRDEDSKGKAEVYSQNRDKPTEVSSDWQPPEGWEKTQLPSNFPLFWHFTDKLGRNFYIKKNNNLAHGGSVLSPFMPHHHQPVNPAIIAYIKHILGLG